MNERCSSVLLNKLPSKEKDPGSFTIPCDIGQLHINNALANLGASISLIPYTTYEKLGPGEPTPTRMSLELTDRVGDDEVIFDIDQSIKRPPNEDDECYGIDDLYDIETLELLENDRSDSFLLKGLEKSIDQSELESCKSLENKPADESDLGIPIRRIDLVNMPYSVEQRTSRPDRVKSEHLYSASTNKIDEKRPELKSLPNHLEYAYLHGDKSFPIIISSKLSEMEKKLLLQDSCMIKSLKLPKSGNQLRFLIQRVPSGCNFHDASCPVLVKLEVNVVVGQIVPAFMVASSGWPFVSAVPGQMTHLVASLTLDSARSCVMQGAFLTQGKASNIPTIFSWGDSISLDGFLSPILLLLVIFVAVVIVVTVVLVVVVSEGWANEFHQDIASSVRVPIANFTLQSSVQLL
ncbi:hypothetical protein Tco_0031445 [Tanacetum coccineum]